MSSCVLSTVLNLHLFHQIESPAFPHPSPTIIHLVVVWRSETLQHMGQLVSDCQAAHSNTRSIRGRQSHKLELV